MSPPPDFPTIEGQHDLATIAQLVRAGWSRDAIRHARAKVWAEPMPRVIAPHRGPLDLKTRQVASWLWAGDQTVASGAMALSIHGLNVKPVKNTTFVAPPTMRARQHGDARVVRSDRPIESPRRAGIIKVAPGARALVDAAMYEPFVPERLELLTITLLQKRLAAPEELEQELHARPMARVEGIWRGLEAFTRGAWSMPEKSVREIVDGSGEFPELLTNVTLETLEGEWLGVPDGYLPEASTVIQVHSRQYHQGFDDQGGDRWARTVEGDNRYTEAGLHVCSVSPWTAYRQPQRFLASLRKVVAVGLAAPPAGVRVRVKRSG